MSDINQLKAEAEQTQAKIAELTAAAAENRKIRADVNARKNQANAIWVAIEPQIRAAEIDLVEDVQRLVGLINTAVNRKRPADADKVLLFLPPIITAAEKLLGES